MGITYLHMYVCNAFYKIVAYAKYFVFTISGTTSIERGKRMASVAGAVIQAIGRPEFEDGLRTGVQLVLRSGLQSVCTHLWSKMTRPMGLA